MKKFKIMLVLSVLVSKLAFASDYLGDLGTLVVTPTGDERVTAFIPSDIQIITSRDIEAGSYSSVAEILRQKGGVKVDDYYGNGMTAVVDIAGYGDQSPQTVLLLVDGRKMDSPDLAGINWGQISPDSIKKIEIIRGPGNILYGDNSNAGVINIITRTAEDGVKKEVSFSGGSYGKTGGSSYISEKFGPFSAAIDVSADRTDGYRDNGYNIGRSVSSNLNYLNTVNSLTLRAGYNFNSYGMPGDIDIEEIKEGRERTDTDDPGNNSTAYDSYFQLKDRLTVSENLRLALKYSYQQKLQENNWTTFIAQRDTYRNTAGIKTVSDAKIADFNNRLTAGYDTHINRLIRKSFGSSDSLRLTSAAFYVLEEFSPAKNLTLTTGWRAQKAKYRFRSSGITNSISRSQNAYKTGLSWIFFKGGRVYGAYADSFRFPKTDQFYTTWPVPDINDAIKSENSKEISGGAEYNYKNYLTADLNYRSIINKNEIYYDPNVGLFGANKNYEDKTGRDIIKVSLKGKPLSGIKLGAEYTLINSSFLDGTYKDNRIPGVPTSKSSIFCRIRPYGGLTVFTSANTIGKRYFINDFKNEYPKLGSYTDLDLSVSYRCKPLTISASVFNLLDRKYSRYGAVGTSVRGVYPAPTRNYSLEMKISY